MNFLLQAVIIPPAKKSETNGVPPQVAEEKKAEEPAAAKPAEPAKKEEPKKEEAKEGEKSEKAEKAEKAETAEKAEKAEKSEEEPKKEEAELKKPSPVNQAIETICGLVCKAIGAVQCAVTKVLSIVNLVKAKILSLPWDCIISLLTTLGVTGGMTLAYWTLTEDMAVFVAPSVAILGPYVLEKLQEKQLLNVKGAHLTGELLKTATLGVHYYIYRTYISLPFWDEDQLPVSMISPLATPSGGEESSYFPISAEDGRNGAFVLVSAISVLSGVAPVAG